MNLPSLGSHMGLPLPKSPQNRCCLWNQNSTIIHGIKPLRRLTPPPRPFRGGNFVYRVSYNRFSPLKGYSPVRGNVCDSRQKGARFRRKRCHEVTEGFQPINNLLPSADTASRVPTVTYIQTDIIIYKRPDTDKLPLRTTAFPHRSVNPRPLLTSNL